MGVKIKDAQLVEQVTGNEKIPVSDGSGSPKAVTTEQLKDYIGVNEGDSNVQSDWNETDPTSDAFIKNKPTIPNEVTKQTVEGWGFTKNTGDYNKPVNGIPKSDLDSNVQDSLNKANSALQEHQDISHLATEEEVITIEANALQAKNDASIAKTEAIKASTNASEALRQAQVSTDAIATLKGLENSDEAMAIIAAEITKIAQNSSDIKGLKEMIVIMTEEEYEAMEDIDQTKIYMLY